MNKDELSFEFGMVLFMIILFNAAVMIFTSMRFNELEETLIKEIRIQSN